MNLRKNLKWYFLIIVFMATLLVWHIVFRESRSGLTVYTLNIGQGDAIFIEAKNGNQILIDGGPNKKILEELGKVMPFYDRKIDAIILTHPHEDHLNGLIEVLKNYKVGAVLESGNSGKTSAYNEFQKIIKEKNIPIFLAKQGMKLDIDSGAELNILLPVLNIINGEIHNQMVVGKLTYGNNSFMFTGDMEQNLEDYLVSVQKENLKSDVLKTGHHGSRTSTSKEFLGWVSPKYAIISAKTGNKYGHPHKEIIERLEKFGVRIFRTDENGIIKLKSNGENIEIIK